MPLRAAEAPAASLEALRATLRTFAKEGAFSTQALRNARPERLTASAPHQVFVLGLDQLTRGDTALESARPTGWRYFIEDGGRAIAVAEVAIRGRRHSFSHFNEGPFVAGTVSAIAAAEKLRAVRSKPHELRLLSVPALHLMALWLRSASGDADLLVPAAPAPEGIEADRAYPAQELLRELERRAEGFGDVSDDRGG